MGLRVTRNSPASRYAPSVFNPNVSYGGSSGSSGGGGSSPAPSPVIKLTDEQRQYSKDNPTKSISEVLAYEPPTPTPITKTAPSVSTTQKLTSQLASSSTSPLLNNEIFNAITKDVAKRFKKFANSTGTPI